MENSPISRYEATGIFLSIAVMAVVLGILRFNGEFERTVAQHEVGAQGAVVVVSEDDAGDSALADALIKSSTSNGELQNLVVDDIIIGSGKEAKKGDTVVTHYIGSTQDGIQFDNSYVKGEPFTFTIGEGKVIEGWEEGLIGMREGGQRILVIPPHLGYGDLSVGPIKANSNLVFAVELLEVK